jgi:CTP:molybdopterin cytidylyltransferase MocA
VIVLAAGASRRLGRAKQLVRVDGEPLVRRAARLALETGPSDAIVVLGASAAELAAHLSDLAVRTVTCEDHASGLGSSLRAGLDALDARVQGALVVVCDQPAVSAEHLLRLRDAWRERPEHAIASGYAGTLGVPALLPRAWFGEVAGGLDQGARSILRGRRGEVGVVYDERLARDLDTPADLPPC